MPKYKDNGVDIATYGSIHVGERSFIGYGATIMPGVKIGKRCVIGAGAVVTHDIPDNSVAAGVPARVISSVEAYADKCLERHNRKQYDLERLTKDRDRYLAELNQKGLL